MMKSFFKKLSLAMALSMVVTTAAPAAQASAAETSVLGIALQTAASKTEVKNTFSVGVDATVDLKYYGAPANYKELNPTWSSSNEKIATVDQKGIVTGVAEGVATITIALNDGTVGTAKVIVGSDYSATALGIALQGAASKEEVITEATVEVDGTVDLKYYGAPKYYKQLNPTWVSSNEEVATVDKNGVVTGVADGVATIVIKLDNGQFGSIAVTVGKGEVEQMEAKQITAYTVDVTFTNPHDFDATGTDGQGSSDNTVKVYRVFSSEEMAKMTNKNGLKFDDEGRGYQAYYVQDTIEHMIDKDTQDFHKWTIEGYDAFVDGALYAVVYGENETSSTIEGIVTFFTAYVGKVAYIELNATEATVENDVEPAIPAEITARLFNSHGIDLTSYYKNADETDYELLTEDIEVSLSGNEVTFDEPGYAKVKGIYTFYDEDKEEDVPITAEITVKGSPYSQYKVEKIYDWSLASGYKSAWGGTTTSMIALDSDQLYVIVEDNRGNLYSNVPDIEKQNCWRWNQFNKKVQVLEIGNGDDNTTFEQYGYELVFDSLDPDSLLVDPDGAIESYKKTNSFAVVSYRYADDDDAKLNEIGVMGIEVKAPRRLAEVIYVDGKTSFTILKETEAEDGISNYYGGAYGDYSADFKLSDTLKIAFKDQYGGAWPSVNCVDKDEVETNFTVTTSKDDFDNIAEQIAEDLNDTGSYYITPAIFAGTNTTSVTFKIKESATGDSQSVTIKLDKPKYVTNVNGDETGEVWVDPNRAIMSVGDADLYYDKGTNAKLFQVSKANQKVGYVRIGAMEINIDDETEYDENRHYYLATDLVKNIRLEGDKVLADYITTAGCTATGSALATGASLTLKEGDFLLVVTDPSGKVVPAVDFARGVNDTDRSRMSYDKKSNLGLIASEDGTHFDFVLAAFNDDGELEYAAPGTYRATAYKITNVVTTDGKTKYTTTRVSSDSFTVSKSFKDVTFFHQEVTKDVTFDSFYNWTDSDNDNIMDANELTANEYAIKKAISETMTFRINGQNFMVKDYWTYDDGTFAGWYEDLQGNREFLATYKSWCGCDNHKLGIELIDVNYRIQDDGNRAVIDTVTFRVNTHSGLYYDCKVKVNRSVNVTND